MRIAVVGAGALGGVVAGLLSIARETSFRRRDDEAIDIWLVGSASSHDYIGEMKNSGMAIEMVPEAAARAMSQVVDRLHSPIRAISATVTPEDAFPCDLAIVAVKSSRTVDAARQIKRMMADDGLVVSLQNGLGNTDIILGILPRHAVIQGTTMIGATLLGPARVRCAGINPTAVAAGSSLSEIQHDRLRLFKAAMERVGASVTVAPDVSGIVWAKLCANCAINPVAALLDVDNGTLVGHGPARLLMKKVVDEVTAVAEAKGIQLPFPPEEAFDRVVKVAEMNARNLCSMVQDLRRGKTTEIEALNGALVREAERLGIDTPANRTLANLIRTRQQFLGSGRILV